ncbi:hypothetical protein EON83_19860 [bacterium]|nr:MAG: hypothetical protein EON83_19860 [bacterium]
MKIPLFISFIAISTLSATYTTARADSVLAVAPLSRNYTIQEIGVIERNEYGFKPEIIGFDEAGKFISNTVSDYDSAFYRPSFPFSSPYLFSPVLPKQQNKSYRVSA